MITLSNPARADHLHGVRRDAGRTVPLGDGCPGCVALADCIEREPSMISTVLATLLDRGPQ